MNTQENRTQERKNQNGGLLSGPIAKQMILLTVPLILGNLLQQFYNTVDTFIIGKYVGTDAFAAVGVAGSIMNLFLFIINGGCNGATVLFSEQYGKGDRKKLKQESLATILTGGGATLVLSIMGLLLMRPLLAALQTPAEIIGYAEQYLRIIYLGLPAAFLYNWCSCALRAVGDTGKAFQILLISVILNGALDLGFVEGLQMGTGGAALATTLSQLISAVWCLLYMKKAHPYLLFDRSTPMAGKPVLFRALQFEGVSALHQSSIYIGKLLVQGAVNTAGLDVITAYTATGKIEGFANSFGDSAAAAVSIFAAQNYGAGNQKRIRDGFYTSLKLLFPLALVMALLMALGGRAASGFLMGAGTGAAMDYAGDYLIIISLFYYICYVDNALVGLLRGIGKIHVPVIGSVLHISIRVVLSYLLIGTLGLPAVAWATGIGWIVVMGYHIWNYRKYRKKAVDSSEETWYNKNTNCRHIESR